MQKDVEKMVRAADWTARNLDRSSIKKEKKYKHYKVVSVLLFKTFFLLF